MPVHENPEQNLVKECLKGDRTAQRKLYDMYSGKMMAICMRYCKDKETAKDLLHDGFIKVYTHLDSFKGAGSFEGWIRRIMVNTALEYLRKQNDEGFHADIDEARTVAGYDMGALESMQTEALIQSIQQLPDIYRTTFNLFVVEGYSHKEIAEKMNITESSSRVYLTRARQMLQAVLKNDRFEE